MKVKTLTLGDYQTNCYIVSVEDSGACILIDPGYEPEHILDCLGGLEVAAILLTHGHFDHVGAVRHIAAETDCPVWLCRDEHDLPPMMSGGPLYCTNMMDEGDVLNLAGLTVKVMKTPGHSPGSVCFRIGDCLFTGDTLFAMSCGRTDFPGSDPKAMQASLRRLSALEGDFTVYPGHGPATALSAEKRMNPYL